MTAGSTTRIHRAIEWEDRRWAAWAMMLMMMAFILSLRPERIAKQSTREHLDDENSSLFMVIVVMSLVVIFVQVEVLGRRLLPVKATKTYVMVR
jgi:uncharacterized membrane protein YhaH (DUF805 family)